MDPLTEFTRLRPLFLALAYRMLSSVAEAEDVVQDAYLKWHGVDAARVESPRAYLTTVVTRLCLDRLGSVQARRTEYVGTWLPDPVAGFALTMPTDPSSSLELAESLSFAFLLMLERLQPMERAVFLLRQAFDVEYPELAEMLGTSEANCRQLFARAHQKLAGEKRFEASLERRGELLDGFRAACDNGDLARLKSLLAKDVMLLADGGGRSTRFGRARALTAPLAGADVVARFLLAVYAQRPAGLAVRRHTINGGPGLLAYADGALVSVLTLDADADGICRLYIVTEPGKLSRLASSSASHLGD